MALLSLDKIGKIVKIQFTPLLVVKHLLSAYCLPERHRDTKIITSVPSEQAAQTPQAKHPMGVQEDTRKGATSDFVLSASQQRE